MALGRLPELPYADVFLVVDNYLAVKQDYEDLADVLTDIAHRGLAYGVHLVLTAPRWHDLRPALQTSIGGGSSCGSATRSTRSSTAGWPGTSAPASPAAA